MIKMVCLFGHLFNLYMLLVYYSCIPVCVEMSYTMFMATRG